MQAIGAVASILGRGRDYQLRAVAAILRQLARPDPEWWARLGEVSQPTLILSGGPTSCIPPHRLAEVTAAIPGARLATIPVGHRVHSLAPAEFADEVLPFLTEPAVAAAPVFAPGAPQPAAAVQTAPGSPQPAAAVQTAPGSPQPAAAVQTAPGSPQPAAAAAAVIAPDRAEHAATALSAPGSAEPAVIASGRPEHAAAAVIVPGNGEPAVATFGADRLVPIAEAA